MSLAAPARRAALDRRPRRWGERLLLGLPLVSAAAAVALYLVVHRRLVLAPAGELLAALAAGVGSADPWPLLSFARLLAPPVALLALLAAAIWPWTRLYHPGATPRLLVTAVLVSTTVVALPTGLARIGSLRPAALAATVAALAALLALAHRARHRRTAGRQSVPAPDRRPLTGGGPLGRLAARYGLAPPTALGLTLGTLAATTWMALVGIAALVPPWGWDSLVYHLTDVFWFSRTGALEPFPHPAHQFHFPKVAELHSLWFYLLAGGGDQAWRVTGIAQLPLALTAAVAVRAAAEQLGLRASLPWLVPAMLLVPLVLIQPAAGYVDLAFTAFLLAGFAFLVTALRRGRTADWALAALACGLALGSKLSFVYLCLPLVVLLAVRPRRMPPLPRLLGRLTLGALLFAVGCGPWLVPSLLRTGNPFHPLAVSVGERTLLDGPVAIETADSHRQRYTGSLAGWLAYPLHERFEGQPAYTPDNGFGPQFAAAYLALPFALALALRRRRRLLVRALLAAPATLVAWLVFSPWEHPRYALAACGFALLGLATLEEETAAGPVASPLGRSLLRLTMAVALLFAAPAGLFAAAPELPRVIARWTAGSWTPTDLYPLRYGYAGEAFNWLSEHGGDGTTVTFDRPTFVAPLFGWHGRNRVVYAATHAERETTGAAFTTSGRGWRRYLEREGVDWVVLWREWWDPAARSTVRERWIAADPDAFTEVAVFGDRARILAPRPDRDAPASGASLAALATDSGWVVEHASGAAAELAADPAGGLRVDYRFLSPRPDYLDLRFDLIEGGWPAGGRLRFELHAPGGSPLLWVYLKEADSRRNCRFRIAPRRPSAKPERVRLELARPDRRSPGFSLRRLAAVHLVLDDGGSPVPSTGSFRLDDFRLERATGGPPGEEGP